MDARREALARLDRAGIRYYVTGSEALAALGIAHRFTNDVDVVIEIAPAAYEPEIRQRFEPDFLVNSLIPTGRRWLGSLVAVADATKVDLIIRRGDAWAAEAFERRIRIDDPGLGQVWVSSVEDLLLAKLEWSEGDLGGVQGRDIRRIIDAVPELEMAYVRRHAIALGIARVLDEALER